jgi:2-isopropylmalate synthase
VGDLVYTSFSGSHQDAIKKGFAALQADADDAGVAIEKFAWGVPYLPIDPKDVGRSYEAVIRVNSQSGKGGVAYIMKEEHKLDLPRRLQIEFSGVVQHHTDVEGGEVDPQQMWDIFAGEYLVDHQTATAFKIESYSTATVDGKVEIDVEVFHRGVRRPLLGVGNGPIDAFVQAIEPLGINARVHDYQEHALTSGGDAQAAAYVEVQVGDVTVWGVGIDANIVSASIKAVTSAVNRAR